MRKSRILTLFLERPIIFLGYSVSDPNIRRILRSISECLENSQLEQLKKRLIFIEWTEDPKAGGISERQFDFDNGKTIIMENIKLSDYSILYSAILDNTVKYDVKALRRIKSQLYELVKTNKPTEKLLELLGFKVADLKDKDNLISLREKLKSVNIAETAEKLEIGEMTLTDIIDELSKPGRDPREDMPKPVLRSDVLKFEDLTEGMILTGTVRNVIDFGAFVDIGVKYDGLVHISEMSDSYIKNPSDLVSVGDIVKVKVIKIDQERKKVGLSMKI